MNDLSPKLINQTILINMLIRSLNQLYKNDAPLLSNNLCERALVFRVGHYLSKLLDEDYPNSEYSVDSEYNRRGSLEKRICSSHAQYPDLILHKRGDTSATDGNNLLVVEFKRARERNYKKGFENDVKKLEHLTQNNDYNYLLGSHVYLENDNYMIVWYIRGNHLDKGYTHNPTPISRKKSSFRSLYQGVSFNDKLDQM